MYQGPRHNFGHKRDPSDVNLESKESWFAESSSNRGGRTRTCNPRFWRPVLCQLSYAPRFGSAIVLAAFPGSRVAPVAGQRRVLGALFLLLAVFFVGIAVTAVQGGGTTAVVIGGAAVVLAFWIGSFGLRALLMRRAR